MIMKKIAVLTFVVCAFFTSYSQTIENESFNKAKTILEKSQKAIFQNLKREMIKSVQIKSNGTFLLESSSQKGDESQPRETKTRKTTEESTSIEFDEKMAQTNFSYDAKKNSAENFSKSEVIVNGEKFSFKTDTINDGKRLDLEALFNDPIIPASLRKQLKEAQEKSKPTKESIQKKVFAQLFPVFLNMDWMKDKTFIYIGKAEAGDKKADILEVESNTGRQTRYFFDDKTHLLLMITDEISKDGKSSKTTTYFDDYQLFDGLLVAKKVNVETEGSAENTELEIMGKKMKISTKIKTISETIIQEFKINPTFKPDTFAVIESK
jgi:hypothetical protein